MSEQTTRQCPSCYERVPDEGAAVCPHCAAVYHAPCLATGCVVAGCAPRSPEALLPGKQAPTWKARALELTIVVMIIAVLGAIAVPNFKSVSGPSPTRNCYANQKTIVGAIEMYNLDKNTKRTMLDGAFFQALKSGGYLQSIPQDPGRGPGTSSNYQTTDLRNGIKCSVHTMIE